MSAQYQVGPVIFMALTCSRDYVFWGCLGRLCYIVPMSTCTSERACINALASTRVRGQLGTKLLLGAQNAHKQVYIMVSVDPLCHHYLDNIPSGRIRGWAAGASFKHLAEKLSLETHKPPLDKAKLFVCPWFSSLSANLKT